MEEVPIEFMVNEDKTSFQQRSVITSVNTGIDFGQLFILFTEKRI